MLAYLLILFMWTPQVYANPIESNYSRSAQWLNFMQYQKSSDQTYKSRVTRGSLFFISARGDQSPEDELSQSLAMFSTPSDFLKKGRGHPQCLYPARYFILKQQLGLQAPEVSCPTFENWLQARNVSDIEVVYAAQFLSNPASVMGHTFLKFENPSVASHLNLSVGYAAEIPKNTGVIDYVSKGLFGGFKGAYSDFPFYQKVHEYTIMESRDLWEYKIAMTPDQKELFLAYIWELSINADIRYQFTDQNCSSEILAALQVAVPNKKLKDDSSFYITPIDSIQILSRNNLIKSEHFRPSLRRQFDSKYAQLSSEQTGTLTDAIRTSEVPSNSEPIVLETLLDYLSLKRQQNQDHLDVVESAFEKNLFLARSQLPSSKMAFKTDTPPSPTQAHPPRNFELEAGADSVVGAIQILTFKPGVHSFTNRDEGYLENSAFSFFEVSIAKRKKSIELAKVGLIEVKNQPNFDLIHRDLSWGFQLAYEKGQQLSCYDCKMISATPELGLSSRVSSWYQVSLVGSPEVRLSSNFDKGYDSWFSVKLGNVFKYKNKLKFFTEVGSQQPIANSSVKNPIASLAGEVKYFNIFKNVDVGSKFLYQRYQGTKNDFALSTVDVGLAF